MFNLSKFDNTAFKPSKHAYTLYAVANKPQSIYVESDIFGDERSATYHFDDWLNIDDSEGFCFSDKFEDALIKHLKGVK